MVKLHTMLWIICFFGPIIPIITRTSYYSCTQSIPLLTENKAKQKQDEQRALAAASIVASKCISHVLFKAMKKTKQKELAGQF